MASVLSLLAAVGGFMEPDPAAPLVASRREIKSYHLAVLHTLRRFEPGGGAVTSTSRYVVWMDGDKQRTDVTVQRDDQQPDRVGQRTVVCRNCERPNYTITTMQGGREVSPVQFFKNGARQNQTPGDEIDWRTVGLLNDCFVMYSTQPHERDLRAIAAMSGATRSVDRTGPTERVRVEGRYPRGGRATSVLAPELGHNPVRLAVEVPVQGQAGVLFTKTTDIAYQHLPGVNIHFPKTVRHRRGFEGGPPVLEDELEISVEAVNQPIPPAAFTLHGLDLAGGTPIELPEVRRREDQPTWRNGKIDKEYTRAKQVAAARSQANAIIEEKPSANWKRWAAAGCAAAAVAVFVTLAVRRWRG